MDRHSRVLTPYYNVRYNTITNDRIELDSTQLEDISTMTLIHDACYGTESAHTHTQRATDLVYILANNYTPNHISL